MVEVNLDYDNQMNLIFDKPLIYKGLKIYPLRMTDYVLSKVVGDSLTLNYIEKEKDIDLLGLDYLDYVYRKALKDTAYKQHWFNITSVLEKVFYGQEVNIDISKENIELTVYQRSKEYKKYKPLLDKLTLRLLTVRSQENRDFFLELKLLEEIHDTKKKMTDRPTILTPLDFENIRAYICLQNDIKEKEKYPAVIEKRLEELYKRDLERSRNNKGSLDVEDLITFVCFYLNMSTEEIAKMTVRRFNRLLSMTLQRDDYMINKLAEMSGQVKFKEPIKHYLNHYEPKDKYADYITDGRGAFGDFRDNLERE